MCQNRIGSSFENCLCLPGYGPENVCNDLDECVPSICSNLATCSNTSGTFNCVCNSGYTGDGVSCSNINECITTEHNCSPYPQGRCIDHPGLYVCVCNEGYRWDGINCTNVNECENSFRCIHSGGVCLDTQGSFECNCRAGFWRIGGRCRDMNECSLRLHNCNTTRQLCINLDGSFQCTDIIGKSATSI